MGTGAITSYVDVAQLVLYLFWAFFAGLIYYLIRENHREGYPMDTDRGIIEGWPRAPDPKIYRMADGREVQVPRDEAPHPTPLAQPVYDSPASPLEPVGDPLQAGIGPGAWTPRPDEPDMDHHGVPKIRPLSLCPGFGVSGRDPDPRGMGVFDVYGDRGGTVVDLWIDAGELMFRYLEVEALRADQTSVRVLLPMPFARITREGVTVKALLAEQMSQVPVTRHTDRVTLNEEERICAFWGGGLLYAEAHRADPLV
ncbi:MAG: PRC-barrel domain-containing protein [Rubrivivax sp.]|nr:PRC-barrel domain-containing protein [Rubrivivax sp.]